MVTSGEGGREGGRRITVHRRRQDLNIDETFNVVPLAYFGIALLFGPSDSSALQQTYSHLVSEWVLS